MKKTDIEKMSNERLIWEFGILSTYNPTPTKSQIQDTYSMIDELASRGIIDKEKMIEEGKRKLLI